MRKYLEDAYKYFESLFSDPTKDQWIQFNEHYRKTWIQEQYQAHNAIKIAAKILYLSNPNAE
jgi:hypothetical protein